MSEKKAKEQRASIVEQITITVYTDGSIKVTGPSGGGVNNFLLFREMMNQAERAILNRISMDMEKKAESRIVKPEGPILAMQ